MAKGSRCSARCSRRTCARRRVEAEIHRRAAVLVEGGLRVHQLLAGDDGRGFEDVENALLVQRGQDLVADARRLAGISVSTDHRLEGQKRRGADDLLELRGRADAGNLDQDALRALSLDGRLAGAHLVDAAADDLEGLAHRAVVGGALLRLRERHHDLVALAAHLQVLGARAGKRHDRAGEPARDLQRARHAVGLGDAHAQLVGRGRLQADRAHGVALVAQRVAQLGPERLHPAFVDVPDLNLGQQMRAAAQVEAEIDDAGGQPRRPEPRLGLQPRRRALALDGGDRVVTGLHPLVEQVRHGQKQSGGHDEPDQDALPEIELEHFADLSSGAAVRTPRARSC